MEILGKAQQLDWASEAARVSAQIASFVPKDTKKPYSDADVAMYQQQVANFMTSRSAYINQYLVAAEEHLDGQHALIASGERELCSREPIADGAGLPGSRTYSWWPWGNPVRYLPSPSTSRNTGLVSANG